MLHARPNRRRNPECSSQGKEVKLDHRSYMDAVYAMDRVRYAKLVAGFVLFAWQRRLLASTHKFKCLNCARQAGKSSIIAVVPTHTAKYKPGSRILVLAATEDQATDDMLKIKACMARDPTYPETHPGVRLPGRHRRREPHRGPLHHREVRPRPQQALGHHRR